MNNRWRILLVEDDPVFAELMLKALQRRGYEARVAVDADTALSLATDMKPDAVVLDLKLGDASGLALIRPLRALDAEMPILLLTGYASIATAVEAIKLGATHYLPKPADLDAILAALGRTEGDADIPLSDEPMSVDRLEWEHIQKVMAENDGNISATARSLKMHRRTLQRKLMKRPVRT